MTESREHFALDWIKREIDETLKAARQALEAYAESDRDETRMRACLTYLHQVDRKSTRLNSSHGKLSRMPSSA